MFAAVFQNTVFNMVIQPHKRTEAHQLKCVSGLYRIVEGKKDAMSLVLFGGEYRNRTGVHGFAIRCVTTPPTRLLWFLLTSGSIPASQG